MSRTAVKICGITRVEDAELAIELGADFLGVNFWPQSPRFLSSASARRIVEVAAGRVPLVGVWVNPSREEVAAADRELALDLHQFHGVEDPASSEWFPGRVIQAIRLDRQTPLTGFGSHDKAWGYLVDSAPDGVYGGTGRSWSYESIANLETSKPVLLAGGLGPENVAAAILRSGTGFVDVCSGVEATPGIKDSDLMRRFFKEVRNVQTEDR